MKEKVAITGGHHSLPECLDRLRLAVGAVDDRDLDRRLGVPPGETEGMREAAETLYAWLFRQALKSGVSVDWLLFGEGRPEFRAGALPSGCLAADPAGEYNPSEGR